MKKLNKKGVSLAELLAVVVIMGIIAAIAIPLVGNVIETSKKKAFIGDLITVKEAVQTYCMVEGKDEVGLLCEKGNASGYAIYNGKDGETVDAAKDNADVKALAKYVSKPFVDIAGDSGASGLTGLIKVKISSNGDITIAVENGNSGGYTVAEKDPVTMLPEDLS